MQELNHREYLKYNSDIFRHDEFRYVFPHRETSRVHSNAGKYDPNDYLSFITIDFFSFKFFLYKQILLVSYFFYLVSNRIYTNYKRKATRTLLGFFEEKNSNFVIYYCDFLKKR